MWKIDTFEKIPEQNNNYINTQANNHQNQGTNNIIKKFTQNNENAIGSNTLIP